MLSYSSEDPNRARMGLKGVARFRDRRLTLPGSSIQHRCSPSPDPQRFVCVCVFESADFIIDSRVNENQLGCSSGAECRVSALSSASTSTACLFSGDLRRQRRCRRCFLSNLAGVMDEREEAADRRPPPVCSHSC